MQNILITGSKGQLGQEFQKIDNEFPEFNFTYTDYEEVDIAKPEQVDRLHKEKNFDILINCAAYTAVDKAEDEKEKAMLLNATAPGALADYCRDNNIFFIHISTDYVFDGKNHKPYLETDVCEPVSAYGISKRKGEIAIEESACPSFIIRTAWLYSNFGHNFVKTIHRLCNERDELKVVYDQYGSPTYAEDLARACLLLLQNNELPGYPEILHYSNEGVCSWYDFAHAIRDFSATDCNIKAIPGAAFPTKAQRPHNSILAKEKIKRKYGIQVPYWRDSLRKCLDK